ncbi:MAG TPA: L,D-transpeptidase [Acidimicrobiia bacterium]|nr:L,D-transpeptidase [Acidimicrobiia bacterium]
MRRGTTLIAALMLLTACGQAATEPPDPGIPEPQVEPVRDDPPVGDPAPLETRPVWEGFEATRHADPTLVAMAHGPVDVYASTEDTAPMTTIDPATILGTVTVLGVVSAPSDGWVEVMLPIRPNGTTGWARADELSFYVADSRIVVDLGDRRLTYIVDGDEVLSTEVGIGSDHNETPVGEFFVTDLVTVTTANSPWGPHALGLSARSDTITEFNGGDGIIGIHGTDNPSSIGGSISLGCVRLPNEIITELYAMVPLGTRVEVRA